MTTIKKISIRQLKGMSPGEQKARLGATPTERAYKLARARKIKGTLNVDDIKRAYASIAGGAVSGKALQNIKRELDRAWKINELKKKFEKTIKNK